MFPIRDHNPSLRRPYVVMGLLALNMLVFLMSYVLQDEAGAVAVWEDWGVTPLRFTMGDGYPTLLTHMFLHGSWMHLLGNMLFLWIFGDNLEDVLGHVRFLGFYILSGLAAAFLQIGYEPQAIVPMVGASGAIAGVMGGYLVLFPKARVDVLLIIVILARLITLPAWIILGLWLALQLYSGLAIPIEGGGVAYWAHVGGFLAGGLMILPLWLARGGRGYWVRNNGLPPHPAGEWPMVKTGVPRVPRRPGRR